MDYIYLGLLFTMILLLYDGITTSVCYAPKKIKYITLCALILVLLRYISLIVLFVNERPLYLYMLKPIMFLEIIYIPIIGFVAIYMLSRNEKIKLSYFYILLIIFTGTYLWITIKSPINTNISDIYGYIISLKKDYGLYIILSIINTIYLIVSIKAYSFKYSNKIGIIFSMISSLTMILTILISLLGSFFFGVKLIGELFWVTTLVYSLSKFKKKVKISYKK